MKFKNRIEKKRQNKTKYKKNLKESKKSIKL